MIFMPSLFKHSAVSLVVVASALAPFGVSAANQPRDCNSNSIVYCGAYTKAELTTKIANGDTLNTASNLQQIFFNEGRGITSVGIDRAVDGTVLKDGRVVVAGQIVATVAMSAGRQYMGGSTKQGSVWIRPVSVSFVSSSIPAFVNMDNGVFHWAILKSCGNTVSAQPVVTPTPTLTPTPIATPILTETPIPTPEEGPIPTPEETPIPIPTPEQPLPDTGAASTLGGVMGLGTLGYAGQAYLRSKSDLIKSLKRK